MERPALSLAVTVDWTAILKSSPRCPQGNCWKAVCGFTLAALCSIPRAVHNELCAAPVLLQARALMIRAQAMRVRLIRQHLYDPAIGDPSAPAFGDHAGQLRL